MATTAAQPVPELSFVMVADEWETARRVMERIATQSVAARIEVVLVVPAACRLVVPPGALDGVGRITVVEHPSHPVGVARAAGVRAARGEIVVIGETHVFPEDDWGERVLGAHAEGWLAVTPAVVNANPGSALSAAALHLDYGLYGPTRPRGRGGALPRTNASVRRDVLVEFGDELGTLLGPLSRLPVPAASILHEPAARIAHLNVDRPVAWFHERYLAGRLVGGARATSFSPRQRALYTLATPLIAGRIFARAARRLATQSGRTPRLLATLALAGVLQAAGEAAGYLTGRLDDAERAMLDYELVKWRHAKGGGA